MKANRILIALVAVVLTLVMVFAVACNNVADRQSATLAETGVTQEAARPNKQAETATTDLHEGHTLEWRNDATEHWRYCTTCQTVVMSTYETHQFGDSGDTCTQCSAPRHTQHQMTVWRYNATQHWHGCYICGESDTDRADHEFVDGLCECGAREKEEYVPEEPDPNADSPYILVGMFGGRDRWADLNGLGLAESNGTWSITRDFKVGDQFKLKKRNVIWDDWQIGYSANKNITKESDVEGAVDKVLFGTNTDGNFVVKYNCTVTISHNGDASSINIHVLAAEGVPENPTEYRYTFHVYAPNWSDVHIHCWGPIGTGDWNNKPAMTNDGNGWWSYTYSTYEELNTSSEQGLVITNGTDSGQSDWNNRITMGGTDDGHGPGAVLKENMYFNALKGNVQFDSKEAALA